jgi:hypothetical protein
MHGRAQDVDVAELVKALDLKSNGFSRVGSNPAVDGMQILNVLDSSKKSHLHMLQIVFFVLRCLFCSAQLSLSMSQGQEHNRTSASAKLALHPQLSFLPRVGTRVGTRTGSGEKLMWSPLRHANDSLQTK